ncbi:SpvB/TcaC N-terminal domain-containing protein [Paraliomyxa miuraensis]|uniref:SpvB/TcaC N-terminal domain-containing protein n=1 Tax=Paraliomyxa miuraensis TaxID=376150 RepID=UPI002259EF85|nr:SpvB/TcaC N-terminal domain-containing protein [Paraliomyxa miuraensis]MCX4239612.1 toxin [Paraliomyxa miuraensis]
MPAPFGRKPEGENEGRRPAGAPSGALGFGRTTTDGVGQGAKADQGEGGNRGPLGDAVPTLALPKGGGAMRGLGEQFQMAAFTGTGSLSIPVVTSPGRGGFGPGLSLGYDSGSGSGAFGLGWSLSPPSVSRKTDRGLPQYLDAEESDVFVLSGAEDLVPAMVESAEGWEQVVLEQDGHRVHRYRPRIETDFARIERWVSSSDGSSHWRVTDRNNVTSYFGRSTDSRVARPGYPRQVFRWLLDRVEDDRGNVSVYEYVGEDLAGVKTRAPWEESRAAGEQPQRYIKRIRYGNRVPVALGEVVDDDQWMFEVVFDYGDHGEVVPSSAEAMTEGLVVPYAPDRPWTARLDPLSTCRPGFELRTRRLCRRVLMFHRFAQLGAGPVLVASTDLEHDASEVVTLLRAVNHRGYVLQGDGTYRAEATPPVRLEYTSAELQKKSKQVDAESLRDVAGGLDGSAVRLLDFDAEGVPGLLVSRGGTWRYKRSEGGGRFGRAVTLPKVPTTAGSAAAQLLDLDGNGMLSVVTLGGMASGTVERTQDGGWGEFRAFSSVPSGLDVRTLESADLTGDGLADLLVDHGDALLWWPSKGRTGYGKPVRVTKPRDEAKAPQIVHRDPQVLVALADMTGDGLADVVRVANGQVAYWPNLGYGRFGARVVMGGLSGFEAENLMRADRVRLADIDGSGTADLVYFDRDGARVWLNGAGNRFQPPVRIKSVPAVHALAHVDVLDLEGRGTGCLVWSSSAPGDREFRLRYVPLLQTKPYLLSSMTNGRGLETRLSYAPSTRFYLEDRAAGRPWVTRLPFPVQVVEQVEVIEHVTGHRMVTSYAYHHGYFDGAEREFRGFGLVEQRDAEAFEAGPAHSLDVAPVLTKTWFHTGAYLGRERISTQLAEEYWAGDPDAVQLPDTTLPPGLKPEEAREAVRALKGTVLRQEVFVEDDTPQAGVPYSVGERSFAVRLEQPRAGQRHAVFFVHEREVLTYHYERVVDDPRLQQSATLDVDAFGNVLRSVAVGYPRRVPTHAEQGQTSVVSSEAEVVNQTAAGGPYRLGVPVEARSFELTHQAADPLQPWSWQELAAKLDAAPVVAFEAEVLPTDEVRRTLSVQRSFYYADDLTGPAPLGQPGARALPYESRAAAFTATQVTAVFGAMVDANLLQDDGGYVLDDGLWWTRSPRQVFDPAQFYLPIAALDPFGNQTSVAYDTDALMVTQVTDPVGNSVQAEHDYRVLSPSLLTDPNGNRVAAGYDGLGQLQRTAALGKLGDTDMDSLLEPTSLLEYDLWAWHDHGTPVWMRTQTREHHGADPGRWLETYAYADGRGQTVMAKVKAQAGTEVYDEVLPDPVERWVGNGRTIRNNKGLPVRQYEPFFSTTSAFEAEAEIVEHGVTPVLHYDPLGRLVSTELPNGTASHVEFSAWEQRSFDPNDDVLGSAWHAERVSLPVGDPQRRAALLTEAHAGTPTVTHLDHLGRAFLAIEHERDAGGVDLYYQTRAQLDVQGNVLRITDANGTLAEQRTYGMLGQVLHTTSIEVGERWALTDVLGAPLHANASRGFSTRHRYDAARRPTHTFVTRPDGATFTATRTVYGEAAPTPTASNLRGQVFRIYDGAGLLEHEAFDVDGNLVRQSRRLAAAYDITPDWAAIDDLEDPAAMNAATTGTLEAETFSTEASFDAMGRPVTKTTPDASVLHLGYGDAGHLETVAANVRGDLAQTSFVTDLRYNARGQRTLVLYGNGTQTAYAYDPLTFRLTQLRTERTADGHPHQDLRYTFDPVGNITEIRDLAQPVVFTSNAAINADQRFEYDALYRLVHAEGREHESQGQPTADDFVSRAAPEDPTGLRAYTEQYLYDAVGNILQMQHAAVGGSWTRHYGYDPALSGNRLLATSAPGDAPGVYSHTYAHDAHGSMTAMPHLAAIDWDWADRMQSADLGGGGTVHFTYDAAGQRVRKIRVNLAGTSTWERIYLGGFELYREHVGAELRLERQTLHVGDDAGRVCLVETKTIDDALPFANPANISRYQYGNHLGTVGLELDETGQLISYEEFHPYGTTVYRAVNSAIEVSPSRYRYTGKERDEETGLGYHSARFYARWLGRWTAADPIGLGDGANRFRYVRNNPVGFGDPSGEFTEPAPELTPHDVANKSDTEIRSHPTYFDNGISSITYYGEDQEATIEYQDGASLTVFTSDIRTQPRPRLTPGTVAFGVTPGDVVEPEVESAYVIDDGSRRIIPGEINIENSPIFTEMLKEARRQVETGTREIGEAGVQIYSDWRFQALVLTPSPNLLLRPTAPTPQVRTRPAGPVMIIEGAADAAHETAQAIRFGAAEGGGRFKFLGNFSRGIEGFFTPAGTSKRIPVSLKDFSGTGATRNILKRINRNAAQVRAAGHDGAAILHARVQVTANEMVSFIDRGPIKNMPSEGVFSRLIFECLDGIVEVGVSGIIRR